MRYFYIIIYTILNFLIYCLNNNLLLLKLFFSFNKKSSLNNNFNEETETHVLYAVASFVQRVRQARWSRVGKQRHVLEERGADLDIVIRRKTHSIVREESESIGKTAKTLRKERAT